jgi:DNA-binding LacI/PurR family transcriptional regulator
MYQWQVSMALKFLTTVSQPNSRIGTAAVEMLLSLIDKKSSESIVMPHSILVGATATAFHPTLTL